MERRNFVQSTLTLLASASLVIPTEAKEAVPHKKGFKVKAFAYRNKEKIAYHDTTIDFKILGSDTGDRFSVFISSNNRKGGGPPLHLHYTFDEFFCVLEGNFLFQLDDEKIPMTPGDTLFIPRNVKHAFDYVGETSGTLFVGISPGKGMEKFFSEMGKLLNVNGPPDMKALQVLFGAYNSKIVGPPIS